MITLENKRFISRVVSVLKRNISGCCPQRFQTVATVVAADDNLKALVAVSVLFRHPWRRSAALSLSEFHFRQGLLPLDTSQEGPDVGGAAAHIALKERKRKTRANCYYCIVSLSTQLTAESTSTALLWSIYLRRTTYGWRKTKRGHVCSHHILEKSRRPVSIHLFLSTSLSLHSRAVMMIRNLNFFF